MVTNVLTRFAQTPIGSIKKDILHQFPVTMATGSALNHIFFALCVREAHCFLLFSLASSCLELD